MGSPSAPPRPPGGDILEVRDLRAVFETEEGTVRAADGVSFSVPRGGTLALVGESGSGKTVTALSILRLVPPPGRIAGGRILLDGVDLLALSEREMRAVRGSRIGMVFQEPMTSLNPVQTAGAQIVEAIRAHPGRLASESGPGTRRVSRREARARAIELLRKVKIPDPGSRFGEYPHRLSGGMRQRVMIAMALACGPSLLVADEATTALDATVQAQVLDLIGELQAEMGMSILFISHNLPLVAGFADRVAVLYAGKVVEAAPAEEIFREPRHPYTRGLLASAPGIGGIRKRRLPAIPGAVPDPLRFPEGCRFHPRCPEARDVCRGEEPALALVSPGHAARCILLGLSGGPLL